MLVRYSLVTYWRAIYIRTYSKREKVFPHLFTIDISIYCNNRGYFSLGGVFVIHDKSYLGLGGVVLDPLRLMRTFFFSFLFEMGKFWNCGLYEYIVNRTALHGTFSYPPL